MAKKATETKHSNISSNKTSRDNSIKGGSHSFYWSQFRYVLRSITGKDRIADELAQLLLDLKTLRHDAAYKSHMVTEKELEKAIKDAKKISQAIPGYIKLEENKTKSKLTNS